MLIHTGQHYDDDMSKGLLRGARDPEPDLYLGIGGGSSTGQTARMLSALERELVRLAPDTVLVYGDTNSTLAGALVAAQLQIPIAHIEAGMRSFDRRMPEEINRVVTDHLSTTLPCSTPTAVENLRREDVRGDIHLVGDVMADVVLGFRAVAQERSDALARFSLTPGGYCLVTSHRQANVDDPARLTAIVGEGVRLSV